MGGISIRTGTPADRDELAEIFRAASLSNEGDREGLLARPELLELSDSPIVDERVRVAEIDGVVVGFATTRADGAVAELEDLFVHPRWMRRGVARQLVLDAGERARADGASELSVVANPHAMDFYLSVGFRGSDAVATDLTPGVRMQLSL